jgi:hypothetical protein
MGEKGAVKILYSEKEPQQGGSVGPGGADDVASAEVRGFLSLDTVTNSLTSLSLSSGRQVSSVICLKRQKSCAQVL